MYIFSVFFCRDCRVVRDPQTLKSKGYGFVSFVKKSVSYASRFWNIKGFPRRQLENVSIKRSLVATQV